MAPKENINFIFQLNNKNRATNFFVLFITSGIVFSGAGFYFVATDKTIELIITVLVAVVYFVLFSKFKPAYFELLVSDQQLQLNYYSVSSTFRNYRSIEMRLSELKAFSFVKLNGGLNTSLVLTVASKYGLADYSPVSIAILSKNEQEQVQKVLQQIIDNNA